jgi:PKHD-type hydroxylase
MSHIISNVLNGNQLTQLRQWIAESPFESGERTAGSRARRVKDNLQMTRDATHRKAIHEMIVSTLLGNSEFRRVALPKSLRPPMISRYQPGMAYGAHVDDALMGKERQTRSDLSFTIFIADPTEYDGGELTIISSIGEDEVKLPAGSMYVYPSSTIHRVQPVTRGERVAIVGWAESYVRDPAKREVLYDIGRIKQLLADQLPNAPETDLVSKTQSNLLRMWAET